MTWPAAIENIVIYGLVAYLIATGHSLWWLLLFAFINSPTKRQVIEN